MDLPDPVLADSVSSMNSKSIPGISVCSRLNFDFTISYLQVAWRLESLSYLRNAV
jgi:hypothetical protein